MLEELGYNLDDNVGDPLSSDDKEDNPQAQDHEAASRVELQDGYEPPRADTLTLDGDSVMPDAADSDTNLPLPTWEA
jgi:hypothetical protein